MGPHLGQGWGKQANSSQVHQYFIEYWGGKEGTGLRGRTTGLGVVCKEASYTGSKACLRRSRVCQPLKVDEESDGWRTRERSREFQAHSRGSKETKGANKTEQVGADAAGKASRGRACKAPSGVHIPGLGPVVLMRRHERGMGRVSPTRPSRTEVCSAL